MIGLIDLDSMIYTVAYNQHKAGNMTDSAQVANHVSRFIATIETNAKCDKYIRIYQKEGHKNFRNVLLPEYKEHRARPEFIDVWKPTIIEAFEDLNAIGMQYIETDDAISILARKFEVNERIIISGDKDLKQIPGTHYDPFKRTANPEERWDSLSLAQATQFFWIQVLTGDATDAPGEFCGIQGVGPVTAVNALTSDDSTYQEIIRKMYTKHYGAEEGFERANLTYKMVSLLKGHENYVPEHVKEEVKQLCDNYQNHVITYQNEIASLFEKPGSVGDAKNLFT